MDIKHLVALFLVIGFCVSARADAVDDYLNAQMKKRQIPGVAIAVVKDGKVVKTAAYGLSDVEDGAPVMTDSVFALASITKQFTAAAILMLIEEKKLSLDDRVNKFLPEPPAAWKDISIRHLLTHTAGLASLQNGFKALGPAWPLDIYTKDAYAAAVKDKVDFAPGDNWQYSDVGYFLLGMVIEKISGKKYADFLTERIFKPLGMTNTSVPELEPILKHRVRGYTLYNGKLINIRRDTQMELASHYGIFSTVGDMVLWDAALSANKLLKPATLSQAFSPVKLNNGTTFPYGFGWELKELRGHRIVEHTGITGTQITRFPDDKLTVIVLTNLGSWGTPETSTVNSWGLTRRIAAVYLPDLEWRPIKDNDPEAGKKIKEYFSKRLLPEPDPKLMTPEFLAVMKPQWSLLQPVYKNAGAVKEAVLVEFKQEGTQRTYRYRVTFTNEVRLILMTLAADGRIADLRGEVID